MLATVTALAVFVLPFAFPPTVPSRSPAYMAGFNNRVAEVAAGLLSLLDLAVALRSGPRHPPQQAQPLGRAWLAWATGFLCALLLAVGAAMVRANIFYGEAEYFLTQMEKGMKLHMALYRDLQFAYGPALYWWPVWCVRGLRHLGLPDQAGYVFALAVLEAAGCVLLFAVVRALPLRLGWQRFCFVLALAALLAPMMAPNYVVFRFVLAPAVAVLTAQQQGGLRAFVAAAGGVLAGLLVSSEVGVACLAAVLALAGYRSLCEGTQWLWLMAAAAAGAGVFVMLAGRAAFAMIVNAGSGGYDLLLTPEPRTLFVLIAAVGLAPWAVARAWRTPSAPVLVALYGCALGTLPVALGRADSVHELSFSLAAILLSVVAVTDAVAAANSPGRAGRLRLRIWVACLVLWVAMAQVANVRLYHAAVADLARQALHPQPDDFDLARLERDLHAHAHGQVHTVFVVDALSWRATQALLDRGLLAPGFYTTFSGVWRAPQEARKVAEMRAAGWALVPEGGLVERVVFLEGPIARWTHLGLPYRQRNAGFDPGAMTAEELARNWVRADTFSHAELYRRIR